MGQRLVFKCIRGGERIATLYFHWSGYTESIYDTAVMLINGLRERNYSKAMTDDEVRLILLDILEKDSTYEWTDRSSGTITATHGGVSDGDKGQAYQAFKELGAEPIVDGLSRNEGLIDITEDGMNQAEWWAEALETFDFDKETFTNGEYSHIPPDEIYEPDERRPDIPVFNPNPRYWDEIRWKDAADAARWFHDLPRYEGYLGVDTDGNYICITA